MKKVTIKRLKRGDLVQVPRTQFAPQRRGWNGWLFSNAIVRDIDPGPKPVIEVEMCMPGKTVNDYKTKIKRFYSDYVFETNAINTAKKFMSSDHITTKEAFYTFIQEDDVTGCDWIKFLVDHGFLFNDEMNNV